MASVPVLAVSWCCVVAVDVDVGVVVDCLSVRGMLLIMLLMKLFSFSEFEFKLEYVLGRYVCCRLVEVVLCV